MPEYTIVRYTLERITVTADSEEAALAKAKEADLGEWYIDECDYTPVDVQDE